MAQRNTTETDAGGDIIDRAHTALGREAHIDLHKTPVALTLEDGVLTAEGELESVSAKRLALECLAALPEVSGIVDRLHVMPAERMEDGEIRDRLREALAQEPALSNIGLCEMQGDDCIVVHEPAGARGRITIRIENGIVTLDGEVPGLAQKRLAGVLAWWVPGSRDVVNGLGVTPPEEDSETEITGAVRVALEKDPFVNAGQIRVRTRGSVVELDGLVPSESERHMAECDAWYVFGVDKVINRIEARP